MQIAGLIVLHLVCLYFLRLLWKDSREAGQRGRMLTKVGLVSKHKSPRLFRFSQWMDFILLSILYAFVIFYSIWLAFD